MIINIVPNNDLKEHNDNIFCECNPSLAIQKSIVDIDITTFILVHNAYDGRK